MKPKKLTDLEIAIKIEEIESEETMKQTAVEWLFEKMTEQGTNPYWDMRFIQAKEMEKDQMINSYLAGKWDEKFTDRKSEEFYEQTYEKK